MCDLPMSLFFERLEDFGLWESEVSGGRSIARFLPHNVDFSLKK